MKQKRNKYPTYYATIPASVRYNAKLSEFQKLLYGEITTLAYKPGYCWAGNSYFAGLYKKNKNRISKCIADLERK